MPSAFNVAAALGLATAADLTAAVAALQSVMTAQQSAAMTQINAVGSALTTAETKVKYAGAAVPTLADGSFAVDYPAGAFAAPPVLSFAVEVANAANALKGHTCHVVGTPTKDGFAGRVRRQRGLPSVLLSLVTLQGYATEEDPGVVTVHVTARPVNTTQATNAATGRTTLTAA